MASNKVHFIVEFFLGKKTTIDWLATKNKINIGKIKTSSSNIYKSVQTDPSYVITVADGVAFTVIN